MRGNDTENLQHRRQRHRPAYLAPSTAGAVQHNIQQQQDHQGKQQQNTYHRRYDHKHVHHQYEKLRNNNDESNYSGVDFNSSNEDGDDDDYESQDYLWNNDTGYDNGNGNASDDGYGIIEDLQVVPLLVKVPYDEDLRLPIVSPPSSDGSAVTNTIDKEEQEDSNSSYSYSPFIIPSSLSLSLQLSSQSILQPKHRHTSSQSSSLSIQQPPQYTPSTLSSLPSSRSRPRSQRLVLLLIILKQTLFGMISSIYYVVLDFLLLIFVCIMGLFFHVEIEVVKGQQQDINDNNNDNYNNDNNNNGHTNTANIHSNESNVLHRGGSGNSRGRIIIQQRQQQQEQKSNDDSYDGNNHGDDARHQYFNSNSHYRRHYRQNHIHHHHLASYYQTDLLRRLPSPRSFDDTATSNNDYDTYNNGNDNDSMTSNPYLMLFGDEMV